MYKSARKTAGQYSLKTKKYIPDILIKLGLILGTLFNQKSMNFSTRTNVNVYQCQVF